MNNQHVIAVWPDGTWCEADEIEEFLTSMSDDYTWHTVVDVVDDGYITQEGALFN